MLTLTGVDCGKSSEIPPREALVNGLEAFCMKIVQCYPADYANAEQCLKYMTDDYGAGKPEPQDPGILAGVAGLVSGLFLEDTSVSSGCVRAVASYFECLGDLTCEVYADDDLFYNYCDYEDEFTQLCGDFLDP